MKDDLVSTLKGLLEIQPHWDFTPHPTGSLGVFAKKKQKKNKPVSPDVPAVMQLLGKLGGQIFKDL